MYHRSSQRGRLRCGEALVLHTFITGALHVVNFEPHPMSTLSVKEVTVNVGTKSLRFPSQGSGRHQTPSNPDSYHSISNETSTLFRELTLGPSHMRSSNARSPAEAEARGSASGNVLPVPSKPPVTGSHMRAPQLIHQLKFQCLGCDREDGLHGRFVLGEAQQPCAGCSC